MWNWIWPSKTLDCSRKWVVTSNAEKTQIASSDCSNILLGSLVIIFIGLTSPLIFIGCKTYITIPRCHENISVNKFFFLHLDSRNLCQRSVSVKFWSVWLSVSSSYQHSIIYFFFLQLYAFYRLFGIEWIPVNKKC